MKHETWILAAVATVVAGALTLRADSTNYAARQVTAAPGIDGLTDEWKAYPHIVMREPQVEDLKVDRSVMAWDATNLYLAVRVIDHAIVNANPLEKLQNADCVELRICPDEARTGIFFRVCLAPSCVEGKPAFTLTRCDITGHSEKRIVATTDTATTNGLRWAVAKEKDSWSVEAALPFALLGIEPRVGGKLPFVVVAWDRDRADTDEWKEWHKRSESSSQKAPASQWPRLVLAEAAAPSEAPGAAAKPRANAARKSAPAVAIERHHPCNLFQPTEEVSFACSTKRFPAGKGEVAAVVSDAFGKEVARHTVPLEIKPGDAGTFTVALGKLPRGYFAINVTVHVTAADGQTSEAATTATFGVMEFVNRTAAEVRAGGYRFGLKWWGGVTDKSETLDMLARLGLQWTRVGQGEAPWVLTNCPMNAVIKIERFPKELYDEARYGDLAAWEAKYGKGAWTLKTLPRKEPYQKWLAESLTTIPKEQNVFEIWNEAWDKMSPEDFSTLSGWIVEVVRKERPTAILGQNLRGDMSAFGYDARVAKAGGLQGMSMVCLHPYAASEDRAWLRAYREWISKLAGRKMELYVTEYGTHSTPAGPAKRSELEQARAVVRQSLALYAEDVKALIPHWVGQSERIPTYIEDWFGFIRRNQEPKPVLLAHANSARLIDSGRYLGDLWYGPGVGAMLFEKNGMRTLALWTEGAATNVTVETDAPRVVLTDMFGAEQTRVTDGGKLRTEVGPDMLYVTGLGAAAAAQASTELRADRWPQPAKPSRNVRTIHKLAAPPVCDGKLDEWKNATQLALLNPKVNGDDASGTGYLAWDDTCLYVAVAMRDNEVLNTRPRAKLYLQDSLELFLSTEARDTQAGYGPTDHQYFITPTSGEGRPIVAELADREAGVLKDIPGLKAFAGKSGAGWVAEVAIPWASLPGAKPAVGARMALEMRLNDADTSHERWKLDPIDGNVRTEDPTAWSVLLLAD